MFKLIGSLYLRSVLRSPAAPRSGGIGFDAVRLHHCAPGSVRHGVGGNVTGKPACGTGVAASPALIARGCRSTKV
ncbi:putative ribonuclease domain protein [Mycobacterium xenopi 3993]|nr:putative ribonuclease domain protein [Mycobacterium xenopi 3993]